MDDEHRWEAEHGEIFGHVVDFLAFGAPIATFLHVLWLDKVLQAFSKFDRAEAVAPLGQRKRQVHEVIEGQTLVTALLAGDRGAELTFEDVTDDTVVSFAEVVVPDL